MSKLLSRLGSFFSSRTFMGVDKTGNKYFTRKEEVDGIMKEKRWVIFKGEDDPTSIPVEWICWLNGQRKKAPTPEEMADLEARRERVKLNVALLKKEEEEEERKSKEGSMRQSMHTVGKVGGPDLNSFIRQFPADSTKGDKLEDEQTRDNTARNSKETEETKPSHPKTEKTPKSSEPKGSGQSFQPGTWQPPV